MVPFLGLTLRLTVLSLLMVSFTAFNSVITLFSAS